MADFTRRGFLAGMSITTGVGIAGGLGLHQLLASGGSPVLSSAGSQAAVGSPPALASVPLDGVSLAGPMIVHVRDVSTGELSLMVGTQELIYRDPELVSRLVNTAASARQAEA
jgi:hypothetical protein